MNFFDSTQNKNWIFTQESIDQQNMNKFKRGLSLLHEIYNNNLGKINTKSKIIFIKN